jgi:hypothetical protein
MSHLSTASNKSNNITKPKPKRTMHNPYATRSVAEPISVTNSPASATKIDVEQELPPPYSSPKDIYDRSSTNQPLVQRFTAVGTQGSRIEAQQQLSPPLPRHLHQQTPQGTTRQQEQEPQTVPATPEQRVTSDNKGDEDNSVIAVVGPKSPLPHTLPFLEAAQDPHKSFYKYLHKFPKPEDGPNWYLGDKFKIPFVPLPSECLFHSFRTFVSELWIARGLPTRPPLKPVRLFVSGANSHVTAIQLIFIVEFVTGAAGVTVYGNGPVGKDVFYIDVHPWDAFRVIRLLHKRILLDELGFYICSTSQEKTICGLYAQTIAIGERVYDHNTNIDNLNDAKQNPHVPLIISGQNYWFHDHNSFTNRCLTLETLEALRSRRVRCRPRGFLQINLCGRENENALDPFCCCTYCRPFFAGQYDQKHGCPSKPDGYDDDVELFLSEVVWPEFYENWVKFDLGISVEEQEGTATFPGCCCAAKPVTSLKGDLGIMPSHANQKWSYQVPGLSPHTRAVKNVLANDNNNNSNFYHSNNNHQQQQPQGDDADDHFQHHLPGGFFRPSRDAKRNEKIRKSDWSELQLGTLKTVCKVNTKKLFEEVLPGVLDDENIAAFDLEYGQFHFPSSGCRFKINNTLRPDRFPSIHHKR